MSPEECQSPRSFPSTGAARHGASWLLDGDRLVVMGGLSADGTIAPEVRVISLADGRLMGEWPLCVPRYLFGDAPRALGERLLVGGLVPASSGLAATCAVELVDVRAADLHEAEAYLAVVARHAAHEHYRQRRRHRSAADSEDPKFVMLHGSELPGMPKAPSAEDIALAEEARAELASEVNLDALGAATAPAAWRAFYAWAMLSVQVDVIADSERVPVPTIYNRIRLAREDLQAFVRRRRAGRRPR